MKKWEIVNKEYLNNLKIFDLYEYKIQSPYTNGKKEFNFYIFDSADWINILPITKKNEVIFVEQYRAGTDSITLELPGGMIDSGETVLKSAKRELFEETGYKSKSWKKLGFVHPNPAILNNSCHTYLAEDVECISTPQNSGSEFTKVKSIHLDKLEELIINKKITHGLVINAIYWYKLFLSKR
tara:strand:+ start:7125 stop:7673 length:549 start_codon:yes stop_codon:yes gene_type:complete